MLPDKKPWRKPTIEELSVNPPINCNIIFPQRTVCTFFGVPQDQVNCNRKPAVLS